MALVVLALTSCNGKSTIAESPQLNSSPVSDAATTPASGAQATKTPDATNPDLSLAGTIRQSDRAGTTIEETFLVGSPSAEATGVPDQVMHDCGADYPVARAQLVFTPATVTIHYTEGSLPTNVTIGISGIVHGGGYGEQVALEQDGSWNCGDAVNQPTTTLTLQPAQKSTFRLWILSPILSNAHPTPAADALNKIEFEETAFADNASSKAPKILGPHARTCGLRDVLFVFAATAEAICP